MTGHAISDSWLAEDLPRGPAQEVIDRVWDATADSPPWREWFETHIRPRDLFTVVYWEERDKRRLVVRDDTLSVYVPAAEVREAHERQGLAEFAAELYQAIYLKWADKLDLPPPPIGHRVEIPSRQQ